MDYNEFNNKIDLDTLFVEIDEALEESPLEYVDVPCGMYEVKLTKLEMGETSSGKLACKGRFKVLTGEYKGQNIFYTQVLTQGFHYVQCVKFLDTLGTEVDCNISNHKPLILNHHQGAYGFYSDLFKEVYQACRGKKEFALEYGENDKGFKTYKVLEVFNVGTN